ncbi:transmembrane protein 17B-like [Pieris brassicae]|nr:transmembrane protein 17B-like [Pieris brassicae]
MDYKSKINFQKCIYFNTWMYIVWFCTAGFFFCIKLQKNQYDHLVKYLSITLFFMFTIIEYIRLYLGQTGNLLSQVPEMAGFLMLSVFMQMPLITYFLFNPYLMNTPIEVTLHAVMWTIIFLEILLGYQALKQASTVAKDLYFGVRTRNG